MSTWAIMRVKDEADIIEATVRHTLAQVDGLVVENNGSTDGTRRLLLEMSIEAEQLILLDDPEVGYYQSRAMSRLAATAQRIGAGWLVPVDADELWLARDGRRIADVLSELPDHVLVAEAELWDHVATPTPWEERALRMVEPKLYGDDVIARMPWRRPEPAPFQKVACRALPGVTIHQGNHGASFPDIDHPPTIKNLLCVHHYPLRSSQQMIRKARNGGAAYAATDLDPSVGAHWRQWNQLSDEQIEEVFREYYFSEDPEADGLVYEPVG